MLNTSALCFLAACITDLLHALWFDCWPYNPTSKTVLCLILCKKYHIIVRPWKYKVAKYKVFIHIRHIKIILFLCRPSYGPIRLIYHHVQIARSVVTISWKSSRIFPTSRTTCRPCVRESEVTQSTIRWWCDLFEHFSIWIPSCGLETWFETKLKIQMNMIDSYGTGLFPGMR